MNYIGYLSDLQELESAKLKMLEHRFRSTGTWSLKLNWDQLYPEHPLPRGEKVRTYWRRGTTEEFIPPNKYYLDRVIVFINPKYKNDDDFKQFYGQKPVEFANTIVNSQIIPVIATPNAYKNVEWGKDFFEILFDNGVMPIYSRRLEDLLAAERDKTEVKIGRFDEFVKERKKQFNVPENVRSTWLEVMGMPPEEYLAERMTWMELPHWDSYRKLLDTDSPLLNYPKLAQDYAFHINYFTNVPYFYSKGGCVTVAPEDLPSMVETMRKILPYFQQAHPICDKLGKIRDFAGNILGRTKKILSKPIYKGDKAEDIKEFSKVSGKDEFQDERNELTEKKVEIFQKRGDGVLKSVKEGDPNPIIDSDVNIESYMDEMQEILNNMNSIMKRELRAEKVRNAAIIIGSIAVSLPAPPQIPIQPLNIACLVDFERSFHLFEVFKLKYKEIDCGPIVVYMQNRDVTKNQIEKMVKIGTITEKEGSEVLEKLSSAFGK